MQLIREDRPPIKVRAFVSLPSDRGTGVGYRHITRVLSVAAQREEMLATALAELHTFRKRYADLSELAGVFEEIEKLMKKHKAKKRKAS